MKRALFSALAVVLVALGLPLLAVSPASAHNASGTATCSGITATASNYNPSYTNTLEIWIDGVSKYSNSNFGSGITGTVTVPVPQNDGLTHSWRRKIYTPEPGAGAYNHDDSGFVGPCGTKHVTAVSWDKTPPTCSADGALVPKTEPAGITVTRNPTTGTGPGTYTITFTAATGFANDGPANQTITVLPKLTGDQCATEVQPVNPTITNPTCTGPGTGNQGSFSLPADGGGIAYTKSGDVVTATADATHKFVTLPSGWTLVDAHHATYTVSYTSPSGYPACLVNVDVPTPPAASAPTCNTDGALVVSPTVHVVTTVDDAIVSQQTSFGPGAHTIAYAPAEGYAFTGEVVTSFSRPVLPKTNDCPTGVVSPTVTQSVCTGPGIKSTPVVTPGDVAGDHVSYVYNSTAHVVTAAPDTGFALANLPAGWVMQEGGTATYAVVLTDPGTCAVTVVSPPTTAPVVAGPKPAKPAVLPNTGASDDLAVLTGGGLALIMAGGLLLLRRRSAQL